MPNKATKRSKTSPATNKKRPAKAKTPKPNAPKSKTRKSKTTTPKTTTPKTTKAEPDSTAKLGGPSATLPPLYAEVGVDPPEKILSVTVFFAKQPPASLVEAAPA